MDNDNTKKRDVLPYNEFIKAHEKAHKAIELKKGKRAHPGTRDIKAEDVYANHDANVYRAAGIEVNKKAADSNDAVKADKPGNNK